MSNYNGFIAQELPEREMEMLYRMLGKNWPKKRKIASGPRLLNFNRTE